MTEQDKDTGLPILGGKVNEKVTPIPVGLLPELREATKNVEESRAKAQMLGYQLVLLLGNVGMIAPEALAREKVYGDLVRKLISLFGLNPAQVKELDLEKGLIVLK